MRFFGNFLVASQESTSPAGASPGMFVQGTARKVGAGDTAFAQEKSADSAGVGGSKIGKPCPPRLFPASSISGFTANTR